jgi:hypothetical protein
VASEVSGEQLDVLIAGDDEAAKEKVAQLGFLHTSLQQPHELGFGSTIKLQL